MMQRRPKEIPCTEFVERVTLYMEGDLSDDQRAEMDQHLEECDGCQIFLDQMRTTVEWTAQINGRRLSVSSEGKTKLMNAFKEWKSGR